MDMENPIDGLKSQILEAALPDIVFDGWHASLINDAAVNSGVSVSDAHLAFPKGLDDLLDYYFITGDQQMMAWLNEAPFPEKIRQRVTQAVRTRVEVDAEHKEVFRRAIAALSLPSRASLALRINYRTVDAIWRWAGDTSTDYNFYTKRAILTGVLASTRLCWLGDDSEDCLDSWAFLDRRIDNVMSFEKTKAQVVKLGAKLSSSLEDCLKTLGNMRYGSAD